MLFMNDAGDMMAFLLRDNTFHYEIRLEGDGIPNVRSYQGCLVSSHNAHLCLLDEARSLSYYHWKGVKWQQVSAWQQVSPCFQTGLDRTGEFHLIIPAEAGSRHYSYAGEKGQETELPFLDPDCQLLAFYAADQDCLLLFQAETSGSSYNVIYYKYHSSSRSWSEKLSLAALPPDCRRLEFFLAGDRVYLAYLVPAQNSNRLHLLVLDPGSGETAHHSFGKLSTAAGLPVLCRLDESLVLLVLEPQNLIYWRSGDGGQTWTTKGELPCPWPLKLAPVLDPRKEITDHVALEGFYGLELSRPAPLTARQLLSLSPYGLWL